MKFKFLTIAAAFVLSAGVAAYAVKAKPGLRQYTQPDGSTVTVRLVGDERCHFYLSVDNFPLVTDSLERLCYATVAADGSVVPSAVVARDAVRRSPSEAAYVAGNDAAALTEKLRRQRLLNSRRRVPQAGMGLYTTQFPSKGDIRSIVILAQYSDVKFTTSNVQSYFNDMLNQGGFSRDGAIGSARDYFMDASCKQFRPSFDVVGPVTLPHPMGYYGANDRNGDDVRPAQMIADACELVDGTVDFSQYDYDNDGYIDNVYVFYAGLGEASGGAENTIWPHSWDLTEANIGTFRFDGKILNHYACSNEIENDKPDGIGTFCHEFGHVMGLPDLYDVDYNYDYTPGEWNIMDSGSYNGDGRVPPTYSAFERNALGWIELEEISGPASVELEHILTSNKAYIIATEKTNEFFLFENRQLKGWDSQLPSHGMLIWHIDFNQQIWDDNLVNNNSRHQYVDLVEAAGITNSYSNDPWPGAKNVTSFTATTTPAFKSWSGKAINLPITGIKEQDYIISFDVDGGSPAASAFGRLTPAVLEPEPVGADSFTARWQPVEGAVDYLLTVAMEETSTPVTETANVGSNSISLPAGWERFSTESYPSKDYVGNAAPSLKLNKDGSYLATKLYDNDITRLEFWYRGANADEDNSLEVQFRSGSGAQWLTAETICPISLSATTAVVTPPAGSRQARLYYNKPYSGNVAVDDVVVTAGGTVATPIAGLDGKSVGNVQSYDVDVADYATQSRHFVYSVVAVDTDGNHSLRSASQPVELSNSTSVADVVPGLEATLHASGLEVRYLGEAGVELVAVDGSGREVAAGRADNAGRASLSLPAPGFYIIRAGNRVLKTVAY